MDWSRAKTLLIVILLCVNIFLIVTYISRENEARNNELTIKNDVSGILASRGISADPDLIPLDSVRLYAATVRKKQNGEALAKKLFGEVSVTENEGNTAYTGDGGNIMFTGDSFSLVYDSGNAVASIEEAEELAAELSSKLTVSTPKSGFTSAQGDGGYVIQVPQLHSGVPVFDCSIEFRVSESGSVIAHGKFIGSGSSRRTESEQKKTSALLLDFADAMEEMGQERLVVREINLGYISVSRSADIVVLTPGLEIVTDAGAFYMSMESGKLV